MANSVKKKNPRGKDIAIGMRAWPLGFSFANYSLGELLDISEYVQKKADKTESKIGINP